MNKRFTFPPFLWITGANGLGVKIEDLVVKILLRKVELVVEKISTPIGFVWIQVDNGHLIRLSFSEDIAGYVELNDEFSDSDKLVIEKVKFQLKEYFLGKRSCFDLPLNFSGTDFQKKAWMALSKIPLGSVVSYKEQAISMGKTGKHSRAVGMANNKNPLPIVVPCHRVIGVSGELVGYAGGLKAKKWLLDHERKLVDQL